MKITREQAIKWNNQAKGGFKFDLQYCLIWSEKTLTRTIKITENIYLEFRLWYTKEYEERTNAHGCTWKVETGRYIPELCVNLLRPTGSGMYTSVPVKRIEMGEPENSKKYATLCRISGEYDAEEYAEEWTAENLEKVGSIPTYTRLM